MCTPEQDVEILQVDIPLNQMIVIGIASYLTGAKVNDFIMRAAESAAQRIVDNATNG